MENEKTIKVNHILPPETVCSGDVADKTSDRFILNKMREMGQDNETLAKTIERDEEFYDLFEIKRSSILFGKKEDEEDPFCLTIKLKQEINRKIEKDEKFSIEELLKYKSIIEKDKTIIAELNNYNLIDEDIENYFCF